MGNGRTVKGMDSSYQRLRTQNASLAAALKAAHDEAEAEREVVKALAAEIRRGTPLDQLAKALVALGIAEEDSPQAAIAKALANPTPAGCVVASTSETPAPVGADVVTALFKTTKSATPEPKGILAGGEAPADLKPQIEKAREQITHNRLPKEDA